MKPNTSIEKKVDKWDGILDPIPFTIEPGADASEKYNIFAMINGYENEGREVLKVTGYPTDLKDLLKSQSKERRIRDIMRMLTYFREVRIYLWMKDAEGAALSMAQAVRCAMLARIRPVEPSINIGESRRRQQQKTRQKRKKWHGLTREQISARNEEIIAHYKRAREKNSTITPNGFAKQHASKYLLGLTQLKKIIKSHLGT